MLHHGTVNRRAESDFNELVEAAQAAPVDGWDFSWLDGRASEARPPWCYSRRAVERLRQARSVLDVQTGGGEVFAEMLQQALPSRTVATEGWAPNLALARERLSPFGTAVVEVPETAGLPFDDTSFDLVLSRHPNVTPWDEVARVLRPGGCYFAQHIGPGSNRELADFMMGPHPVSDLRAPDRARREAEQAGLEVVDLQSAALKVEFFDVGAVVYFLRKVIWTVPGFTVDRYRDRLAELHALIGRQGSFVSHSQRFLIDAVRPEGD